MKKNSLFAIILLIAFQISTYVQSQEYIDFQIEVRDNNNKLMLNKKVGLKLNILEQTQSGKVVYGETHNSTTNSKGVINVKIGSGKRISGNYSTIDWEKHEHFVEVSIDKSGATNYQLLGTSKLNYESSKQSNESYKSISIDINNISKDSEVPEVFTYEVGLINENKKSIANKKISIKIEIIEGNANGKSVYSESHQITSGSNGKAIMKIGKGKQISGKYSEVEWERSKFYIKIWVDFDAGTDYKSLGNAQFLFDSKQVSSNNKNNKDKNKVKKPYIKYINYQISPTKYSFSSDSTFDILVNILEKENEKLQVYSENHKLKVDKNNMLKFTIGKGDSLSGNYKTIKWDSLKHFIEIKSKNSSNKYELLSLTEYIDNSYSKNYPLRKENAPDIMSNGGSIKINNISIYGDKAQLISFMAQAKDHNGNVIKNKNLAFKINIFENNIEGKNVYSETHKLNTNDSGLVNVFVGNGNVESGNFSSLFWGKYEHYIKILMDETGGDSYTEMGNGKMFLLPCTVGDCNKGGSFSMGSYKMTDVTGGEYNPKSLNYRVEAKDKDGNSISNKIIGMKVDVKKDGENGENVYSETHQLQTDDKGFGYLQIGKGQKVSGDFGKIDWDNNKYFFGLSADANGGTDYKQFGYAEIKSSLSKNMNSDSLKYAQYGYGYYNIIDRGRISGDYKAFKYNMIAKDKHGMVLSNKNLSYKMNMRRASMSGKLLYSETHNVKSAQNGFVSFKLGDGKKISGEFSEMYPGNNDYVEFLLDQNGGTNYQSFGKTELLSTVYANRFKAKMNSQGNNMTFNANSNISSQNFTAFLSANECKDVGDKSNYYKVKTYPDPFIKHCIIEYQLEKDSYSILSIYQKDKHIKTLIKNNQKAGKHNIKWDGTDENGRKVKKGFYTVKICIDGELGVKEMVYKKTDM